MRNENEKLVSPKNKKILFNMKLAEPREKAVEKKIQSKIN